MHISTKCSVALHCLIFIYEYGEKTRVTSDLLSKSTGINAATIRNIFRALKKEDIITVKAGTGGAELNCSPDEVSLYRVCRTLEPEFLSKLIGVHRSPSSLCPVGRNIHHVLDCSYQKIRSDLKESLGNITLADIISDYEGVEQEEKESGEGKEIENQ